MGLSEIFIRVLCIGSVILYAASATLITSPQVQVSPLVVSKISQLKDNATSELQSQTVDDQFLIQNLSSRINGLESLFRSIGGQLKPLSIVIDRDRLARVSIGATDIILGSEAAKATGQLERAIIKAWVRQVGSSEVLTNPLRVEVYADLILALYQGELNLQDPANKQIAKFKELSNWNNELLGTAELCESPWRPAELISYCDGVNTNNAKSQTSYSLRNVVGSLIWNDLSKLSLLEKRNSLESISRSVRSQTITAALIEQSDTKNNLEKAPSLTHLKSSIEQEAQEIFPGLVSSLPEGILSVGLLKEDKLSMAGGFEVSSLESSQFSKIIVESCRPVSVNQLLAKTNDKTEHILLVQNCESSRISYSGFVIQGPARFASDNKSVKFAYLHRDSLKLAGKMIQNFDIQAVLAFDTSLPTLSNSKDAKFLGLDQKIFREDIGAYKVNGPIGAIEWYRSEVPSVRESHS